jgi:hypothetical protein
MVNGLLLELIGDTDVSYTSIANTDLWNEAFAAMLPIDKDLAKRLNASSRFWSDPTVWQLEPAAMELVPELDELSEQCDLILVELMRRLK